MNDILVNLIVLAGVAGLVGLIFLFVMRKQKQEKETLQAFVQQKGWQLEWIRERLAKGYRIISAEWMLESVSRSADTESGPGSSNIEKKTTWFCAQPGSTILIGPRTSQTNLGPMAEILKAQILQMALGKDAQGISEIIVGSQAFQKSFMVWAQDEKEANQLITPSLQSALLTWMKVPPLIKQTSSGVTIELNGTYLNKTEDILRLIQLGEKLL